jgi:hypothetical protein
MAFGIGIISVEFDRRQVRKLKRLTREWPEDARRAMGRAANRAAKSGVAEIKRQVRTVSGVKAKAIGERVRVKKGTFGRRKAQIVIFKRPISLGEFGARQNKRGVTVLVTKQGGRKLIRGGIIRKRGKGKTIVAPPQFVIGSGMHKRFGPSVVDLMKSGKLTKKVENHIADVMEKRVASQIDLILSGAQSG